MSNMTRLNVLEVVTETEPFERHSCEQKKVSIEKI